MNSTFVKQLQTRMPVNGSKAILMHCWPLIGIVGTKS
jgi:hypothetical protein